jgi:sucrose-6-phosphate hydrolase SacC (GH32 family)
MGQRSTFLFALTALACSFAAYASDTAGSNAAKGIAVAAGGLYQETWRPQYHFTARTNWHNDPNGLVFYKGLYHMFFQHNPTGIDWGNMTWGHAVSPDMIHWAPLDNAILPDRLGTIFSGSAVVDWNNTAGFQKGDEKALVLIYTSAGGTSEESKGQPFTQSIAYSADGGRTFTKYERNPVLGHIVVGNRDPKVFWHEPSRKWVMALYLDKDQYALFGSPNLKEWTRLCDVPLPGSNECPDFFELAVDGDPKNMRWVFWGANENYLLGAFDGRTFTKQSGPHPSNWGANSYAAQTWSDVPSSDGRRLQIAWMRGGKYPGMPFNQQMSLPRELTLRKLPEGIRLFKAPAREAASLRGRKYRLRSGPLRPGENPLAAVSGERLEIIAEFEPESAREVGLVVRGEKVRYDVAAQKLLCMGREAPLAPAKGRVGLHVFLDRSSLEIFANDGLVSMPFCFLPNRADKAVSMYADGGEARVVTLDVYELNSIWPAAGRE